jgi:glutamine synthetase
VNSDDTEYEGDPRTLLENAIKELNIFGFELKVDYEMEF